jgi:hypothetical protein
VLFAAAGTAAFAGDSVKAGGPSDKPGAQHRGQHVKTRGASGETRPYRRRGKEDGQGKNDSSQPAVPQMLKSQPSRPKHNSGEPGRTVDASGQKDSN